MNIQTIQDWRAVEAIRADWDQLIARCPEVSLYQTFDWNHAWWSVFKDVASLAFVAIRDSNGVLLGVSPLCVAVETLNCRRRRVLRCIGYSTSDYCDFIVDGRNQSMREAIVTALVEGILKLRTEWDVFELCDHPSSSPNRDLIRAAFRQRGVFCSDYFSCESPAHVFGNQSEDQAVLNKESTKRHQKALEKLGNLNFRHLEQPEEVLDSLAHFFVQHQERFALKREQSQFEDQRQKAFFREIAKTLLPKQWLRFSVLELNGRAIAYHFGFEFRGVYFWYKPAFDSQLQKKSPGEILLKYLIEYSMKNNLSEFDFSGGCEPYKYRFSNRIRSNRRIMAFQSSWDCLVQKLRSKLGHLKRKVVDRKPESAGALWLCWINFLYEDTRIELVIISL